MKTTLQSLRFRPTFAPSLAALGVVLLTGYLGLWQQHRMEEKQALQREFEARSGQPPLVLNAATRDPAMRFRQARAVGEWRSAGQIFLDNQVKDEVVGYHVFAPLKLAGSDTFVLVNRGWVARGSTYPVPPAMVVPPGPVSVAGQLTLPSARFFELSAQFVQGSVWQNLTIERYRDAMHLDVLPLVLLAQGTPAPLQPVTEHPDARASKHMEYMLTWYSLAVTAIVLWVALNTSLSGADDAALKSRADPTPSVDNEIET
ncbi:MAG: SURF1 family protein [Betaproteobacteria bacterium]